MNVSGTWAEVMPCYADAKMATGPTSVRFHSSNFFHSKYHDAEDDRTISTASTERGRAWRRPLVVLTARKSRSVSVSLPRVRPLRRGEPVNRTFVKLSRRKSVGSSSRSSSRSFSLSSCPPSSRRSRSSQRSSRTSSRSRTRSVSSSIARPRNRNCKRRAERNSSFSAEPERRKKLRRNAIDVKDLVDPNTALQRHKERLSAWHAYKNGVVDDPAKPVPPGLGRVEVVAPDKKASETIPTVEAKSTCTAFRKFKRAQVVPLAS